MTTKPTAPQLLKFLADHAIDLELRWFEHEGNDWVSIAYHWPNVLPGSSPIVATLCWTSVLSHLAGQHGLV